jgi:tetracycline 7-halogenase / FADH2 O2-dependent halogenase
MPQHVERVVDLHIERVVDLIDPAINHIYFAAASFGETTRRLGMPERAKGFLMCDDPVFGPETRACTGAALAMPDGPARRTLLERIDRAIEPIDVAGLGDRGRRDWYPVLASDLDRAAAKLDAAPVQIAQLLERSGVAPSAWPQNAVRN